MLTDKSSAIEAPVVPPGASRKARLEGYRREHDVVLQTKEFVASVQREPADERYQHPTPGLVGDPYNPEEVQKRQEAFAKKFGALEPVQPAVAHSIREFIGGNQKNHYHNWFEKLDPAIQRRVIARLERIKHGDKGDMRPLTGGVFELRLFFGPGYRIYFAEEGESGIVLLTAGEKSTQEENIVEAKALRKELMKTKSP
jgi:putative addiction module killer protein